MSEIAGRLTDTEASAIAKWLAVQRVSGQPSPVGALLPELAHRCGSIILEQGDAK